MNYDLTGGTPPKNTGSPLQDNFIRHDSALQAIDMGGNPSEMNQRIDVNGSTDKIFPQERNFVMNPDFLTDKIGEGAIYTPSTTSPDVRLGQIKYAKRAGVESVYKDVTRNTNNDNQASAKAEASQTWDYNDSYKSEEAEESQGI